MAGWLDRWREVWSSASGRRAGRAGRTAAKPGARAQAEVAVRPLPRAWLAVAGVALLALHMVLFPPVPRLSTDFPAADDVAPASIKAPFEFEAKLDPRVVAEAKGEAARAVPPVLRRDAVRTARSEARLAVLLDALSAAAADSLGDVFEAAGLLAVEYPQTSESQLVRLLSTDEPALMIAQLRGTWSEVLAGGVADILPAGRYDHVSVTEGESEALVDLQTILVEERLATVVAAELRRAGLDRDEAEAAVELTAPLVRPNLVYLEEETRARRERARQAVSPTRTIRQSENIVLGGEVVSEQQARVLNELATLLRQRGGGEDAGGQVRRHAMRAALVAVALALYAWLAGIHFRRRLQDWRFLAAVVTILALYMSGAALALSRPSLGPMAVPVVLLSLLVTVLYKGRIGYTTTLLAVTLMAVLPDVPATHVFLWYVLGMVTVLSVRRIQKRSQFYRTILLLTVLSVVLVALLEVGGEQAGATPYLVSLFAPALMVAFGLFLLPLVEPLIGVCSDLTLLELSDLNHPLLQRMALEAQGTYHHSQVVGQLAEHAARAIDANALLTRVGALFHDIGKMEKPEYYVENQRPDFNKHDELSPSMSALVIAAHVKDGMELGRKWRLPSMVIDFIPEHHGTMVMEYFYHKALEGDGNAPVKVDDFRYPGPKPRSRETAILMCADAVEAAARSLSKPTPSRIKEITKQIIDKRMLSGELDESGLSLSDIARIREAFIPLLTGIHHARIVYPGQKDREGERATEKRGEKKART